MKNDGIGSNDDIIAKFDITQYFSSRSNENIITDPRDTIRAGPATNCDTRAYGYIPSNPGTAVQNYANTTIPKERPIADGALVGDRRIIE